MSFSARRYNRRSSKKYGWHPSWFNKNLNEFDERLIESVKYFQMMHDLQVDGKVGPNTFRRILAERDLQKSDNYVLINGRQVDTHWDATTSAEKCKRVLQARKISTHFCIDNDGVIYQYVDTNNVAWHAGGVNKYSIGIDFSNAYYTKYNDWYEKKGFGKRPVLKDSKVHGIRLKPHLGYYKIQIEAYKKLVAVLCNHYDIPVCTPMINDSFTDNGVVEEAARGKYKGIVCHYHLTRGKIDCAGLDLKSIVEQLS
jgi:hypothetical protein